MGPPVPGPFTRTLTRRGTTPVLLAAFVGWVAVSARIAGTDPTPAAALIVACAVGWWAADHITRRHATLAPALVCLAVTLLAASFGSEATANRTGPLGYSNATAALYVVAAGAAGLVVLRSPRTWVRAAFAVLGLGLAWLSWPADVIAGRGTGAVIVAAVAILLARGAPRRRFVPATTAVLAAVLLTTVVAGALYTGDGEGDRAGALSERRLLLWSEALELLARSPVTGIGASGFAEHGRAVTGDDAASWAHHEPLQFAAENGLVGAGLATLVAVVVLLRLEAGGERRGAALGAVVLTVAFAHACVDYVWHFPAVPVALAITLGAAASTSPGASTPPGGAPPAGVSATR